MSTPVHDMMQNKQDKHGCAHPFIDRFPNQHIRHLKEKQHCHDKVDSYFYHCFTLHTKSPPTMAVSEYHSVLTMPLSHFPIVPNSPVLIRSVPSPTFLQDSDTDVSPVRSLDEMT